MTNQAGLFKESERRVLPGLRGTAAVSPTITGRGGRKRTFLCSGAGGRRGEEKPVNE